MRKFLILLLACIMGYAGNLVVDEPCGRNAEGAVYPAACIIVELDYQNDLVTVSDVAGTLWQFYGCEDYSEGDLVRMLMYDNGTETIYDDEIVIVWYAGTLEQFENIWRGE